MKYLKQDEIDKYMMELDKYYRNILFTLPAQDEVDEMYSFLNLYVLYARQNINQEWFNIISILKSQKNNSVCNSVVKWNQILAKKDMNKSLKMIYPKKNTKGIPVIIPTVESFMNVKTDTKEMKLEWQKSYVYPIESINLPPLINYSADMPIMERISLLGKNEKLDQPVEIFNMVDFNDVNEFINVFLNDLVHSSDSLFRLEYTKKEFVFFFELLKYSFVCCTNYYDSDDLEKCNGIPSTLLLINHEDEVLLLLHDICSVIRKFTSYLATKFNHFIEEEIVRQEKIKIKERYNRNIKQRINDAKEMIQELE